MSDRASLAERTRAARALVRAPWDDAHASHLAERAIARRRRRTIARGAAVGSMMIAAAFALAWLGPTPPPAPEAPAMARVEEAGGVLRFRDGSVATPLDAETELLVETMREDAIELVLVRGAARFEVTPGLPRAFRVRTGRVTVSVVGTVFTVRRSGEGAEVSVDEGRVRIEWAPDGHATLSAGEHGTYPTAVAPTSVAPTIDGPRDPAIDAVRAPATGEARASVAPAPTAEPIPDRAEAASEPAVRVAAGRGRERPPRADGEGEEIEVPEASPGPPEDARAEWRALADQGRFAEGYGLLLADSSVLPSRDVESLMQAADCARLSGHPAESLAYLQRALEVGRSDPRAPMAAFTLGRVLLQQLGRPRDAAAAFARARELSPEGSLASDALAREVEAWHRAGDAERARERALEYLRLYPQGLRAAAVRQHGGLEQ